MQQNPSNCYADVVKFKWGQILAQKVGIGLQNTDFPRTCQVAPTPLCEWEIS